MKVLYRALTFTFFLSVLFTKLFSQDFYFNQDGGIVYLNIKIPDNWSNLNLSEANDFLIETGFSRVNMINNGDKILVAGIISTKEYTYTRLLAFKNNLVISYTDKVVFMQPCVLCFAKEAKQKLSSNPTMTDILENGYQKAIKQDEKLKNLFYKNHTESLRRDGINDQLLGDITDYGFSFSNSIRKDEYTLYRNCSLALDHPAYVFTSERTVVVNEINCYVNDFNLKEINQYDLKLMVNVFLQDCKNHNIKVGANQIFATFEKLDGQLLGRSYGINIDTKIILKIDPIKWEAASAPKRWYLLYHELGHDVLNLQHGNGGKMMFNFAEKGYSWKEFWEDKNYMFESYKRK